MKRILIFNAAILLAGLAGRSQTISPPDLACASTLVNGDVLLTWNLPSNSCGPFVSYDIFASNSGAGGPYSLLTNILIQSATSYLHSGANGTSVTWHYFMMSDHNCVGFTALSSDTLDNLDPVAPALINATVINNSVELNWLPFVSPETEAFIIYRNNGGFNPIDTVFGRNSAQYVDATSQPSIQPEEYIIAAMDSCGNTGTTTPVAHKTIHLIYAVASCAGFIDLTWTGYQGFSVSGFDVMVSTNGGAFQTAATLPASASAYQLTGFSDQDSLCIYVEANDGGTVTARSNMVCFKVNLTQALQDLVLTGLTVLADQTVEIAWQASKADLVKMIVQRSEDGANFSNIKTFTPPFPNPITMTFNDTLVDPSEQPWFYRVTANDSCGDTLRTAAVKTIWLKGKPRPNFTNTLEWNDPGFLNGPVITYSVHLLDGTWSFRASTTFPEFTDNISTLISGNGEFCYYVEALGVMSLPSGSMNFVAASNIHCVKQYAIIHAPTAFVPYGTNNVFKPVITFGTQGTYIMSIYNRYGQQIFQTADPNEGWDGTFDSRQAPQGVYAYVIQVQGPNYNIEVKTGTVMLIR